MVETNRDIPLDARDFKAPNIPEELDLTDEVEDDDDGEQLEISDIEITEDENGEVLNDTDIEVLEGPHKVENPREIHEIEKIAGGIAEQLKETYFASSKNPEQGTEISIALAKGEKRDKKDRGEDSVLLDKETGLHGIADGLGGVGKKGSGGLASERAMAFLPESYTVAKAEILSKPLTREMIIAFVEDQLEGEGVTRDTPQFLTRRNTLLSELASNHDEILIEMIALQRAIEATHQKIKKLNKEDQGNTTLSVGKTITLEDGRRIEVYAQVGDGKIRKIRADGSSVDCVKEHSLANILRAKGINIDAPGFTINLGGKIRDKKYIDTAMTHALGGTVEHARPFIGARVMQEGESMVYASDGIADVDEAVEKIAGIVLDTKENRTVAQKILDTTKAVEATQQNPKHDDKAVLSVTFGERANSETQVA